MPMSTLQLINRIPLKETLSRIEKASTVELTAGKLLKLKAQSEDFDITCLEGTIWITQEKDRNDYFLSPGESFKTSRKGLIIVQPLSKDGKRADRSLVRVA